MHVWHKQHKNKINNKMKDQQFHNYSIFWLYWTVMEKDGLQKNDQQGVYPGLRTQPTVLLCNIQMMYTSF